MPAREKELRGFLLTQQPEHRPSAARQHAAHPTVEKLCQYAAFVKAQQLNGALAQGTVPDRLIREERAEKLLGWNFFERLQMLLDHRDAIKGCFTDNAELVGQMVQKFFLVENTPRSRKRSRTDDRALAVRPNDHSLHGHEGRVIIAWWPNFHATVGPGLDIKQPTYIPGRLGPYNHKNYTYAVEWADGESSNTQVNEPQTGWIRYKADKFAFKFMQNDSFFEEIWGYFSNKYTYTSVGRTIVRS